MKYIFDQFNTQPCVYVCLFICFFLSLFVCTTIFYDVKTYNVMTYAIMTSLHITSWYHHIWRHDQWSPCYFLAYVRCFHLNVNSILVILSFQQSDKNLIGPLRKPVKLVFFLVFMVRPSCYHFPSILEISEGLKNLIKLKHKSPAERIRNFRRLLTYI